MKLTGWHNHCVDQSGYGPLGPNRSMIFLFFLCPSPESGLQTVGPRLVGFGPWISGYNRNHFTCHYKGAIGKSANSHDSNSKVDTFSILEVTDVQNKRFRSFFNIFILFALFRLERIQRVSAIIISMGLVSFIIQTFQILSYRVRFI